MTQKPNARLGGLIPRLQILWTLLIGIAGCPKPKSVVEDNSPPSIPFFQECTLLDPYIKPGTGHFYDPLTYRDDGESMDVEPDDSMMVPSLEQTDPFTSPANRLLGDGTQQRADFVEGGTTAQSSHFKASGYLLDISAYPNYYSHRIPPLRLWAREIYRCESTCTVGLIAPNVAVTAAHCIILAALTSNMDSYDYVKERPLLLAVGFGNVCEESDASRRAQRVDVPCPSGKDSPSPTKNQFGIVPPPRYDSIYRVVKVRIHPNYTPNYTTSGAISGRDYDIAYLILDRAVKGVTPAGISYSTEGIGKKCKLAYMIGYGSDHRRGRLWLRYHRMESRGSVAWGIFIPSSQTGTNSEEGDSGAPIYGWYTPNTLGPIASRPIVGIHKGRTTLQTEGLPDWQPPPLPSVGIPVAVMFSGVWGFLQSGLQIGKNVQEMARAGKDVCEIP